MKFSPWFTWEEPPTRVGWYQVKGSFMENKRGNRCTRTRRHWNGKNWLWLSAYTQKMQSAAVGYGDVWRGLIK